MELQEMFDVVVKHLAAQKRRSVGENGKCLYRGPEGRKCAVGVLIPDEKYIPDFEGFSPSLSKHVVPEQRLIATAAGLETEEQVNLANDLQMAHDVCESLPELHSRLEKIAEGRGLDPAAISLITEWSA